MVKNTLPLLFLILIVCACSPGTNPRDTLGPGTPFADWYQVYFTNPDSPSASSYRGGPDEALASAIDLARVTVDMAIYDINLWSVRDALISAHQRGIGVRVVTESDNMDEMEVQELKQAGIEVVGDRREGLMHHKFVVIDRSEVWTGSLNYTAGGTYHDNNNLIHITSTTLAEKYGQEFEQMFMYANFGPAKNRSTTPQTLTVNNSLIEIYFSPQDGTLEHILDVINSAQESIYFLAYSFTSNELADALIEQEKSGVTVSGIFDKDQYHSNQGTEFDRLIEAGLQVYLDGNPRLMHHKVIIVDQQIVITGSYNFSNNAEHNNDENTLIIHDQAIAAQYMAEFQQILEQSQR